MAKWLRSGLRRDVCVVLYALGRVTGQECKAALEDHYGERIEPKTFYGALDSLEGGGHVAERADGIHDSYALTDAGAERLREHAAWLEARLAEGAETDHGVEG